MSNRQIKVINRKIEFLYSLRDNIETYNANSIVNKSDRELQEFKNHIWYELSDKISELTKKRKDEEFLIWLQTAKFSCTVKISSKDYETILSMDSITNFYDMKAIILSVLRQFESSDDLHHKYLDSVTPRMLWDGGLNIAVTVGGKNDFYLVEFSG